MHWAEGISDILILGYGFIVGVIFCVGADARGAKSNHASFYTNRLCTFEAKIGDDLVGMKIAIQFSKINHLVFEYKVQYFNKLI